MEKRLHDAPPVIGRRHLLTGAGGAAVLGAAGAAGLPTKAAAASTLKRAKPAPSPIPGGQDADPVGFINWFLPGPDGAVTPVLGLPSDALGLDTEPSTMTDYRGFTVFAVLAGEAKGSDGRTYPVEFDVRVMEGEYVAADGARKRGTFAFL